LFLLTKLPLALTAEWKISEFISNWVSAPALAPTLSRAACHRTWLPVLTMCHQSQTLNRQACSDEARLLQGTLPDSWNLLPAATYPLCHLCESVSSLQQSNNPSRSGRKHFPAVPGAFVIAHVQISTNSDELNTCSS
jgi:hypothetical protein